MYKNIAETLRSIERTRNARLATTSDALGVAHAVFTSERLDSRKNALAVTCSGLREDLIAIMCFENAKLSPMQKIIAFGPLGDQT